MASNQKVRVISTGTNGKNQMTAMVIVSNAQGRRTRHLLQVRKGGDFIGVARGLDGSLKTDLVFAPEQLGL